MSIVVENRQHLYHTKWLPKKIVLAYNYKEVKNRNKRSANVMFFGGAKKDGNRREWPNSARKKD